MEQIRCKECEKEMSEFWRIYCDECLEKREEAN